MKFVDNSEIQACWEFGSDSREPLEILVVFFFMCFLHPLTQLPSTKRGVLLVLSISTTQAQFVTRDKFHKWPLHDALSRLSALVDTQQSPLSNSSLAAHEQKS